MGGWFNARLLSFAILAVALIAGPVTARAQLTSGIVDGVVTAPDGRRAAGVTVNRLRTVLLPTPGEIFGYMLDTLFTDQVYGDLEQLERINTLVRSAPQATRGERLVETLMLAPSVDPREIFTASIAFSGENSDRLGGLCRDSCRGSYVRGT